MNTTKIRPSDTNTDEISFLWTPGEKLVELVSTPTDGLSFAIRETGPVCYAKTFDKYSPISWLEQYVQVGALRLGSCAVPNVSLDDLAERVRGFIHKYFDCSPAFESVATLYVLHTWVYEQFQAVPYLRFLGLSGTGKTRGTEVIWALCYRPLVIAGSATPAVVFRMIEAIGGTMLIDEADFSQSQIGSEIAKVLNCGYQRGLPVSRMEKNDSGGFVPKLYEVFGPKIINGRRAFQDDAMESRCLAYTPQLTDRADIPSQLPPAFDTELTEIQNMALGWRMENLDSFAVKQIALPGLKGRGRQLSVPLLSITSAMSHEGCTQYRENLVGFLSNLEQQAVADRRDTAEGKLVVAFVSLSESGVPTCKELVDEVLNDDHGNDPQLQRWLTPKKASKILRGMGFHTQHTNHGAEVTIDLGRLSTLCKRFGVGQDEAA